MGEVFKLNHCYNMDCLPAMELFPDNYFDLAVVDPPYFSGPERRGFYGSKVSKIGVHRDYPVSPELGRLWNTPGLDHPGGGEVMWDKLQTHGDRRNDAEVLAIAAAGAPLDIMAMFFESHIEELPDLCVEKLAEAFDKRASNTSCHRESENWKDLAAWARIELKRRKSNGRICENTGCSDGFGSCGTVGGTDFLCACRTD